jgi:hypothetical protein
MNVEMHVYAFVVARFSLYSSRHVTHVQKWSIVAHTITAMAAVAAPSAPSARATMPDGTTTVLQTPMTPLSVTFVSLFDDQRTGLSLDIWLTYKG